MNIIERIKALNLPLGQYVIVGSGAMEAFGIRKAADIDIGVTQELYESLQGVANAWKQEGVEMKTKLLNGNYPVTMQELIKSAVMVEEVPFMNLDELVKFKRVRASEKDLKDIELIEAYLKR